MWCALVKPSLKYRHTKRWHDDDDDKESTTTTVVKGCNSDCYKDGNGGFDGYNICVALTLHGSAPVPFFPRERLDQEVAEITHDSPVGPEHRQTAFGVSAAHVPLINHMGYCRAGHGTATSMHACMHAYIHTRMQARTALAQNCTAIGKHTKHTGCVFTRLRHTLRGGHKLWSVYTMFSHSISLSLSLSVPFKSLTFTSSPFISLGLFSSLSHIGHTKQSAVR